MEAVIHKDIEGHAGLKLVTLPDIQPGKGEVKVRLKTAGLNHRDLFFAQQPSEQDPPWVIGSDGAGVVESVGEGVTSPAVGTEVIINPSLGWERPKTSVLLRESSAAHRMEPSRHRS